MFHNKIRLEISLLFLTNELKKKVSPFILNHLI